MKKIKIALALSCCLSTLSALEFGMIGSQAFGMAGTGVAIKKSAWGLYYNPSLMDVDGDFKLGLSIDARTKSQNFTQLFDRDFNNLNQEDIQEVQELLKNNQLGITSQLGGVFQIDVDFGTIGAGAFATLSALGQAQTTLPPVQDLPKASINDLNLQTHFTSYALIEAPVGYAYNFDTPIGDISLGMAVKYMNLSAVSGSAKIEANSDLEDSFKAMLKSNTEGSVSGVGVDLGMYYEPIDLLSFGLVGKNLNAPKFKLGNQEITIDPQARAGMALNVGFWTLGFDADLTQNKDLGTDFKTQMLSLGTSIDFKFIALRGGVAMDMLHKDDMIFSLGLGLAFLDVGIQFGKKTNPLNGITMPDYFALQVGAGFSF